MRVRGRGEFVYRAAHREAGGERLKEVDGYPKGQQRDRAGKCAVGPCTERGGEAHGGAVRRVRSTGGAHSDGGRRVLQWGCTWNEPEMHGGAVHGRTWASACGAAHGDRCTWGAQSEGGGICGPSPYVGVFFRPVGDEPFFFFLKYRPPTGSWESHRPHCCTPLSFTTVRTAALPYCCPVIILFFQYLYIENDTFTTVRTAALPHCPVIILLF